MAACRKTRRTVIVPLSVIVFSSAMLACTKAPPVIQQHFFQVNLFRDAERGTVVQKASLYLLAADDDGLDDLESIFLINDLEQLVWQADGKRFSRAVLNNQTWIGMNSIMMNDLSLLPEGGYRVLVRDFGGEVAEKSFELSYPDFNPKTVSFPVLSFADGLVRISGNYQGYIIWLYDREGNFIDLVHYTGKKLETKTLAQKNPKLGPAFTCYVYTYDSSLMMGIVSGPFHSVGS